MGHRFDHRVVIITGACGTLGQAYADAFAARGAKLVLNDLGTSLDGAVTSGGAAADLARRISQAGGQAVADDGDISEPTAAQRLVSTALEAYGRVDAVIHNAGVMRNKAFKKMPPEDFRRVVQVHLFGAAWLTQAALAPMIEQNFGRLVFTTSAGGLYGAFGVANYGAAKTALLGLMKVIRIEGARHGVLANAVAPVAASRMTEGLLPPDAEAALSPGWVTPAVLHLASEECQASGDILVAAGGHYAKAEILESIGVRFTGAPPAPEDIAARYDEISDMTRATSLQDLSAALQKAALLDAITPAAAPR